MAAKTFWTREQAESLVTTLLPTFGEGSQYNVSEEVERTVVCGDIRRDPQVTAVKHLCIVAVVREGMEESIPTVREKIKSNVQAIFMGSSIRNFKMYDYVEIPDGTGNVSWLVVPTAQAGAATLHATGPVTFCKMVEMFADSRGLVLGASGVKRGDEKLQTLDEQAVFSAIGAEFVPLDLRESVRYIDPVSP